MTTNSPRSDADGGWVPSNTHPSNTRIVASCCDTLYVGYYGELRPGAALELERQRERLVSAREAATDRASWQEAEAEFRLVGTTFVHQPIGKHGYRHRLFNKDVTLLVRSSASSTAPTVTAQFRSEFLWRVGWKAATTALAEIVGSLVREDGRVPTVTRADLCVDFQGWIPVEEDRSRFVCRARKQSAHWDAPFTGLVFGKSNVVARLYDKTREIVHSGKDWMRVIWSHAGYSATKPVWRLEFEVKRDGLRERGISTLDDLDRSTGALWRHLAHSWLRLVLLRPGTRIERCPTDPNWASLRVDAFENSVDAGIVRRAAAAADIERILIGLRGYLSSYAAETGVADLGEAMRSAEAALRDRQASTGQSFQDQVQRKVRRRHGVRSLSIA